jgi:hypothetical protein
MEEIIKAKIEETKEEYNTLGLYTHEEYVGRISAFNELLSLYRYSPSLTDEEVNNTL